MVAASSRSSPMMTPPSSHCVTGVPSRISTPSRSSDFRAASLSVGGKADSTRDPASTSTMRASRGSMSREVAAQGNARQLGDGAGHLHASRPAADHHEGE